jgi:hypothetical protein
LLSFLVLPRFRIRYLVKGFTHTIWGCNVFIANNEEYTTAVTSIHDIFTV